MTPFGEKVRTLRKDKNITLKEMAKSIGISAPYLSALEHGHRSRPSWYLIQRIIAYFNVIWDDAEDLQRLARISHPKVTIDTSGLSAKATELTNRLSEDIARLDEKDLTEMIGKLDRLPKE